MPDCIRAISSGEPISLRNPYATRPWQHVLEPLAGYILLAARLYEDPKRWGGAWNFGPSTQDVHTVEYVASLIIKHLGKGSFEVTKSSAQVHEANLLQLNCDKAHQLLRWYPRWNAEQTLEATALWFKAVMNGESPESVTRSQIKEFFWELT